MVVIRTQRAVKKDMKKTKCFSFLEKNRVSNNNSLFKINFQI